MANAKSNPNDPDLTLYNDFQLLHYFTSLVSKESSLALKVSAWEIMRRYNSHLSNNSKQPNTKGDTPKWGDAKRVEYIYGLRRGVLTSLREDGLIKSKSLNEGRKGSQAKRLYNLLSIEAYLQSTNQN